ncbi:tRNA (adenine-N(1)-)-methyltransferase catalytic subunit trm61 [Coemansia spiralis]|uniref:tRNA (adenine(58)-N(1))-methyltransferase catalytic subunit TRM61 n=2 Tax=Coemansia TaxID=4863 RepID=A0A9W8G725_9FUNG|nr:tRNA methyltransferase complex GCD14 subunit-domain-containing protein [Coemansia spiralis]KAJ1991522.1 tRNA (adenine-N(1)-)-methyltransferase catalytic subunit trm61 [Coemansia umbellata]KAJ2621524.1 tRNA (adenine-N(1)-)-methyltransferase catalytic subunit trm61 [Coemansia sp. RSA 1358]KAJ2676752.1 tRNA (adenine-N(1)-)-methyltransferase catalytic subunit trm61 [Coemansia spiralis]
MFHKYKSVIEEGDTIIVYVSPEAMRPVHVKSGEIFNNRFGSFRHSDMIGLRYGSKLRSNNDKGFVYLLHPTPALWTQVVPHRTQILYLPDISFISLYLDLRPGKVMIECGTGSGSFSHSIARTIAPTGHLYTFEYHELRAATAKKEFEEHNLSSIITIEHRDVLANGFGKTDIADAVFLDLPAPWEAIASAKDALRKDTIGRICCFSPCIEQVQATALALDEHGFSEIRMFECLAKDNEVRTVPFPDIEEAINGQKINFKLSKCDRKKRKLESEPASGGHDDEGKDAEILISKPIDTARGHTSYLTFAILAPEVEEE